MRFVGREDSGAFDGIVFLTPLFDFFFAQALRYTSSRDRNTVLDRRTGLRRVRFAFRSRPGAHHATGRAQGKNRPVSVDRRDLRDQGMPDIAAGGRVVGVRGTQDWRTFFAFGVAVLPPIAVHERTVRPRSVGDRQTDAYRGGARELGTSVLTNASPFQSLVEAGARVTFSRRPVLESPAIMPYTNAQLSWLGGVTDVT